MVLKCENVRDGLPVAARSAVGIILVQVAIEAMVVLKPAREETASFRMVLAQPSRVRGCGGMLREAHSPTLRSRAEGGGWERALWCGRVPSICPNWISTKNKKSWVGRFRLERGQRYFAALQSVYGGLSRHRLELVTDVGHDHSLVWDGSLEHLFS